MWHWTRIRHTLYLDRLHRWGMGASCKYRQISNIRRTQSQNLKVSRLILQLSFVESFEVMYKVENEDVVGAAPTGDAPTTSEWSTILVPTKVRLILEVWRYTIYLGKEKLYYDRNGLHGWIIAILRYLHCQPTADNAVLHWSIGITSSGHWR